MDPQVQAAKRGDVNAMEELVREHYPTVYRFCARRLGRELARDVAQETFIAATTKLQQFGERSSFLTWILGIANNHCRNEARKRRIELIPPDGWLDQHSSNPEGSIIDRELLRGALKHLSPEHREVIVLHEIEGLSYEEAAQIVGVPEGTIKSRLHHAFLRLRIVLKNEMEVTR
jgi:RNA polymerase sigma-70 factor (ECF subfamily)